MLRTCAIFVLCLIPHLAVADPSGRIRVIDGDTWDVGGERVRLFAIDAPEADQTCQTPEGAVWRCGQWVSQQVKARYDGRQARCTTIDTDRYGRAVARCTVGGRDVGRALVSDGLAFAYRKYAMDYDLDEKAAVVNDRGLHGSRFQSPAQFRAARRSAVQPSRQDCPIKGNVSSKGVKIYHLPGQEHYDKTRINTAKGERWFCSEAEARQAGWRRSRR
ncbi:thermonuclease family protein [Sedimentitalea sp. XS_ASV28]|uniref:thermonuclease family protein n=1 Tax=Sedimentitalea sp. XS_ASV28 TaxID=3241296 RepID=UPI003519BAD6